MVSYIYTSIICCFHIPAPILACINNFHIRFVILLTIPSYFKDIPYFIEYHMIFSHGTLLTEYSYKQDYMATLLLFSMYVFQYWKIYLQTMLNFTLKFSANIESALRSKIVESRNNQVLNSIWILLICLKKCFWKNV